MFSPQCSPPQESASAGNHNLRETNQRCIFALDHNWPQYLCHFLHSWRYGILFTWIHWYLVLFYHNPFLVLWFWTKLVKGPEVKWNDAKSLIIAVEGEAEIEHLCFSHSLAHGECLEAWRTILRFLQESTYTSQKIRNHFWDLAFFCRILRNNVMDVELYLFGWSHCLLTIVH